MGLLKQWRDVAYSQQADKGKLQKFWANYFTIERGIYGVAGYNVGTADMILKILDL